MDVFNQGDDEHAWWKRTRAYMERAQAEPCPICGKEPTLFAKLKIKPGFHSGWYTYDVACIRCNISGVSRLTMYGAVKVWNNMAKRVRAKIEERQDGEVHD